MRAIPENMLTAFQDQQGLELKFIIEINWSGLETVRYSTCEFDGLEIYAYVKEFGAFQSVSHVEGLGSVSSMSVVFYDQFGHFRDKIDNVDFFNDTTATIYLTLDGTELYDLFEGVISDAASWANNEFTIEVLSNTLDRELGYQPSIDDVDEEDPNYDFLSRHLNTGAAWPAVFGTVKNYEAPLIYTQRFAEVTEDYEYAAGTDPFELIIENHDDFTLESDYLVNIVGKDNAFFSILGTGQFSTHPDDASEFANSPIFLLNRTGVTSNWYSNIPFDFLDNEGIAGDTDAPATRIELNPGSFTIGETSYETTGPDGETTSVVFAEFMKIEIRFTRVTGATAVTYSKYYNCVKQVDNICTLNEIVTLPSGATNIYIRSISKANDIIYKIPSGSKIYVLGDKVRYAIDTYTGTVLDRVGVRRGDELITINPAAYITATTALWTGTQPDLLYLEMNAELYMRYLEHYSLESSDNQSLLISAHNSFITDKLAIAQMSGITTNDDVPTSTNFVFLDVEQAVDVIPEIAWQSNKAVRYTRQNNDDILELIDLTDTTSPAVYTFTEDRVLKGSISYSFTSKDDLYTVFTGQFQSNNLARDLQTIKTKKNADKYGEILLDSDFYVHTSKSVATTKLNWWRDKLSSYHYVVSLTGFMDAFGLEVWDRVYLDFDPAQFYDPADGTPFTNTHTSDIQPWVGYGRIKEISPDLETGLIEFKIEIEDF